MGVQDLSRPGKGLWWSFSWHGFPRNTDILPVRPQSTAGYVATSRFAIFSRTFICLVGLNWWLASCFCWQCKEAGLNMDSLDLTVHPFLDFPGAPLLWQTTRACSTKSWMMNDPQWQENESLADKRCTTFTSVLLLLAAVLKMHLTSSLLPQRVFSIYSTQWGCTAATAVGLAVQWS